MLDRNCAIDESMESVDATLCRPSLARAGDGGGKYLNRRLKTRNAATTQRNAGTAATRRGESTQRCMSAAATRRGDTYYWRVDTAMYNRDIAVTNLSRTNY